MAAHPSQRHVPSSAITAFIDRARIDRLLSPWVADAAERAFVIRCMLDEGPAHHRGANYVLLSLVGEALSKDPSPSPGETVPVPLRLPPHLAAAADDPSFPLRLPLAPIERLAPRDSSAFHAMIDCLTDGPPQHSLANVAMVCLLSALLEQKKA